ncbi:MAG TPA: hypothetical protein VM491_02290 [Burkholderiaceae bacterium]|nr:hypothetical protein [Burkholderiaceae bacterium]
MLKRLKQRFADQRRQKALSDLERGIAAFAAKREFVVVARDDTLASMRNRLQEARAVHAAAIASGRGSDTAGGLAELESTTAELIAGAEARSAQILEQIDREIEAMRVMRDAALRFETTR